MFKKWFNRFKSPKKSGIATDQSFDSDRFAKIFEIELSNMEGTPSYTLTHQITIGSEIGNIVVADPSVSPRHATFILQQEVISIIDHSSFSGTYINGKKINAGKYIILEDSDVIAVGDLEVRIKVKHEAFPEETAPDAPALDENLPEFEPATPAGDLQLDDIKNPNLTSKPGKQTATPAPVENKVMTFKVQSTAGSAAGSEASRSRKKKFKFTMRSYHAANTLVRILAILGDVLLSYVIVEILWPFDDFKHFIAYVPQLFFDLIDLPPEYIWELISSDVPEIKPVWDEVMTAASQIIQVGPVFITFIIVRLFTTFLMGVSISEFMLGIRAMGNGIWNRIGGILRVLIGLVTGPFLIFDFPALFSKRTFKELLTFTNTDAESKSMTIIGIVLWYPVLILLILLSPLFQGMEIIQPIDVITRIDKRVKTAPKPDEVAVAEVPMVIDGSKVLGVELPYPGKDVSIVPTFKFLGGKSKLQYRNGLVFYLKELKRPVQVDLFKKFDLKELLALALRGNFMLFNKFPQLYEYSHAITDKSFVVGQTPETQEVFAKEFIEYTRLAFGLSLDNILQVAETQTFMVKNLVDYKASLLSLLEYKDFTKLDLVQIGNTIFFRASYNTAKPFDLLIPLTKGPGRIIKVTFDKKTNLKDVSSKLYKFVLEKSNWLSPSYPGISEKLTALEASDYFSGLDVKSKIVDRARTMALYGYYFETAADILRRGDMDEYGLLKKSVEGANEIFEKWFTTGSRLPEHADTESLVLKNFRDLKQAVDGRNMSFFGLEQTI